MEETAGRGKDNGMPKAMWNGAVIAESDRVVEVEGNYYFPPEAVDKSFLRDSDTKTVCPWKGTASYYHIEVEGRVNKDAAWYYPDMKDAGKRIEGLIAFWRGVEVTD